MAQYGASNVRDPIVTVKAHIPILPGISDSSAGPGGVPTHASRESLSAIRARRPWHGRPGEQCEAS